MRRVAARLRTQLARMRTAQSNPLAEQTERPMIWQVFFYSYGLFDASPWITEEVFWPVLFNQTDSWIRRIVSGGTRRQAPDVWHGVVIQGAILCLGLLVVFLGLLLMSSKDSAIFKLQIAVGIMLEQKPPEGAASKWLDISDLRWNAPEATALVATDRRCWGPVA